MCALQRALLQRERVRARSTHHAAHRRKRARKQSNFTNNKLKHTTDLNRERGF
jgi:hypothetical protein